jgi:acetyl-CoA carboxylase biotin carboxyl carrier protein
MDSPSPDDVRQLAEFMREHGLVEMELEEETHAIRLRFAEAAASSRSAEAASQANPPRDLTELVSPMTGVFYRTSDPGQPPYVSAGDHVSVGDVVGLIEAMKVFNEITAEVSGQVVEVRVGHEAHVEEGDTLMILRRA